MPVVFTHDWWLPYWTAQGWRNWENIGAICVDDENEAQEGSEIKVKGFVLVSVSLKSLLDTQREMSGMHIQLRVCER